MLITGFATGPGDVNCYLLAAAPGAAAIVIDPGDEAVPTLEYYFSVNGFTPAAVLLTHGHAAHAASAFDLGVGWDIPTYLHPADRSLLAELGAEQPDNLVDLDDGDQITLADILVSVDHTPGHTPGSVVYRVTAEEDDGPVPVLFTGDTVDAAAAKLVALGDRTVVLPGHGSATTLGVIRRSLGEQGEQTQL